MQFCYNFLEYLLFFLMIFKSDVFQFFDKEINPSPIH